MKHVVTKLKLGDMIEGRVEELLPGSEALICISGDLLRVHNDTSKPLRCGDRVTLVVKAIKPLRFQLIEERKEQRRKGHINLNV